MLQDVHGRLASVIIECMGYAELIAKYDSRPDALFYLDRPCWGCTDDHG